MLNEDTGQELGRFALEPELVIKPVQGAGASGVVIGPQADAAALAAVRAAIEANPAGWVISPGPFARWGDWATPRTSPRPSRTSGPST